MFDVLVSVGGWTGVLKWNVSEIVAQSYIAKDMAWHPGRTYSLRPAAFRREG